jgi:hypothetical protein
MSITVQEKNILMPRGGIKFKEYDQMYCQIDNLFEKAGLSEKSFRECA